MSNITCPADNGTLIEDYEETRKRGTMMVYYCELCGRMFVLNEIGQKLIGWKTKKRLDNAKEISQIPF